MAKAKKGLAPSFDAMVNFFLNHYNFATKKDIDKLVKKVEELEKLIKNLSLPLTRHESAVLKKNCTTVKTEQTTSDSILQVIRSLKTGATFSDIKLKTGFNDKKIRNIIYQLGKQKKIKSKKRGVYILL